MIVYFDSSVQLAYIILLGRIYPHHQHSHTKKYDANNCFNGKDDQHPRGWKLVQFILTAGGALFPKSNVEFDKQVRSSLNRQLFATHYMLDVLATKNLLCGPSYSTTAVD